MGRIWFEEQELAGYTGTAVVQLYSGGLDSMYTALGMAQRGYDVHALYVDVGQERPENLEEACAALGVQLIIVDGKTTLCDEYLSKGIQSNALYNDVFPISSSYTRPLIAAQAVAYAESIGAELIVHSATPYQNSTSRFNLSILALAKEMHVYCPAVGQYVSREEKIAQLRRAGIPLDAEKRLYSIDENLWARVIENGTLEQPWIDLPAKGVFTWTTDPEHCGEEPITVTLSFEKGLPVQLDGSSMSLAEMIASLNTSLGRYGVGRYSGLEDGAFGLKNPEVREAPAAEMIHKSHLLLEEMILSSEELRIKKMLDREWTRLVVAGGWYSPLKRALDAAIAALNQDITGQIRWRVTNGQIMPIARESVHALYSAASDSFPGELFPYSLGTFYQQLARKQRVHL
ncbi:argininosuccinate synthase [Brevibacillus humidisoli]|uniref:argininosuccinate synthase n=1 Tax=Brevibacillus humidisoli TaxID=2895522 RepID=UPI001E45A2C4|nr:argininosuccinate synthase [Brevibacillus humidisoli]UFJ42471.1 argininosuccinate synthase [Brevibacillus humidisoli]